jgi:hypothetical protein
LAGIAALAPVAGAQWMFVAAAQAPRPFSPPQSPMVLSRTVIRELSGGQQIVVKRSFRVQFVPSADGFILTGTPIDVSVQVPPMLARLGDLERQRSDLGPFPIRIDGQGLIHSSADGQSADMTARQSGRQLGQKMIEATPMPAERKREGTQLLGQLATDPRTSPWPTDLFVARDGERRQHRSVALADGSQGEVEVLLKVDKWLPSGIPAQFERVVTTELAGTRRVSRELWSLEPLTGP